MTRLPKPAAGAAEATMAELDALAAELSEGRFQRFGDLTWHALNGGEEVQLVVSGRGGRKLAAAYDWVMMANGSAKRAFHLRPEVVQ